MKYHIRSQAKIRLGTNNLFHSNDEGILRNYIPDSGFFYIWQALLLKPFLNKPGFAGP